MIVVSTNIPCPQGVITVSADVVRVESIGQSDCCSGISLTILHLRFQQLTTMMYSVTLSLWIPHGLLTPVTRVSEQEASIESEPLYALKAKWTLSYRRRSAGKVAVLADAKRAAAFGVGATSAHRSAVC